MYRTNILLYLYHYVCNLPLYVYHYTYTCITIRVSLTQLIYRHNILGLTDIHRIQLQLSQTQDYMHTITDTGLTDNMHGTPHMVLTDIGFNHSCHRCSITDIGFTYITYMTYRYRIQLQLSQSDCHRHGITDIVLTYRTRRHRTTHIVVTDIEVQAQQECRHRSTHIVVQTQD